MKGCEFLGYLSDFRLLKDSEEFVILVIEYKMKTKEICRLMM
jgi:hypothetical protein